MVEKNSIDPVIDQVAQQILCLHPVEKMILFSRKGDLAGGTASFKLCVVADVENSGELEREIYYSVDSPLPFDVVVYTAEQWQAQVKIPHSFASKVQEKGVVVYG